MHPSEGDPDSLTKFISLYWHPQTKPKSLVFSHIMEKLKLSLILSLRGIGLRYCGKRFKKSSELYQNKQENPGKAPKHKQDIKQANKNKPVLKL